MLKCCCAGFGNYSVSQLALYCVAGEKDYDKGPVEKFRFASRAADADFSATAGFDIRLQVFEFEFFTASTTKDRAELIGVAAFSALNFHTESSLGCYKQNSFSQKRPQKAAAINV